MKKSLSLFVILLVATSVMVVVFGASAVFADSDYGLTVTAGEAGLAQYGKDVPKIAGNIIGAALSLISVLFFALMLYGGIRAMLARGKAEEFSKAIDTIIHAIIGILIVFGAYAITTFILSSVGPQGSAAVGGGGAGSPTTQTQVLNSDKWCIDTIVSECLKGGSGQCFDTDDQCQDALVGSGGDGSYYCPTDCIAGTEASVGGVSCFSSQPACLTAVQDSLGKDVGGACTIQEECKSTLFCVVGVCKASKNGLGGECATGSDCENSLTCSSGACVSSSYTCNPAGSSSPCGGSAAGAGCDFSGAGSGGGYCNPAPESTVSNDCTCTASGF